MNSFYGWGIGIRLLISQCEWVIRIVLFAKNDILYRFLNAQTLSGSNPYITRNEKSSHHKCSNCF